jgi:hypothetical protein
LSLHTELKTIFNQDTIRQAEKLEPQMVDALAVKEAAGALLLLKGEPSKQMALVNTMKPSTAAALCRWLTDPVFWTLVAGITTH